MATQKSAGYKLKRTEKSLERSGSVNRESGQSLVELAISFVILMFLLSGAVEFGLAFFQYVQLRDSAQEGALYGSFCPDPNQIEARARGASDKPLDLHGVNVGIEIQNDGFEGGGIRVTLLYDHEVFMPFVDKFTGDFITLRATVVDTILSTEGCG